MKYPAGGGMNAAARVRREKVRIQAATMFEKFETTAQIAAELRVSAKSVRQWRRRWTAGGTAALASTGPRGSDCKLSTDQQKRLAEMLDGDPVVHGCDDARWTLARVAELAVHAPSLYYRLRDRAELMTTVAREVVRWPGQPHSTHYLRAFLGAHQVALLAGEQSRSDPPG